MIIFNDIRETDIPGVFLSDRKIYAPRKKKIKVEIPFMSGSYDFSTVGSGGDIVYRDRIIECKFGIEAKSKEELQIRYDEFLNWLYTSGKNIIMFDDLPGVYFIGEVETEPSWREIVKYGETTVTFVCDPYKYFENKKIDIASPTSVYNPGMKTLSKLNFYGTGDIILKINNLTFPFNITDKNSITVNMYKGENKISWTGSVSRIEIEPNWRCI